MDPTVYPSNSFKSKNNRAENGGNSSWQRSKDEPDNIQGQDPNDRPRSKAATHLWSRGIIYSFITMPVLFWA
jgi:hypothetical protein